MKSLNELLLHECINGDASVVLFANVVAFWLQCPSQRIFTLCLNQHFSMIFFFYYSQFLRLSQRSILNSLHINFVTSCSFDFFISLNIFLIFFPFLLYLSRRIVNLVQNEISTLDKKKGSNSLLMKANEFAQHFQLINSHPTGCFYTHS